MTMETLMLETQAQMAALTWTPFGWLNLRQGETAPAPTHPLERGAHWFGLTLDHPKLLEAVNRVRAWFNQVILTGPDQPATAMLLSGGNGSGKSHIAHVLAGRLSGAVFWSEHELISEIWHAYSEDNGQDYRAIKGARQAPLFILDDLGSDRRPTKTSWITTLYQQLFDYHPIFGRGAVFVTTNLAWCVNDRYPLVERLGQTAASRLIGLLGGIDSETGYPLRWIDVMGVPDHRLRPF